MNTVRQVQIEEPYSYDLPDERIAQRPVQPYDSAKLLVIDRALGSFRDQMFFELPQLLRRGDLLVVNDTRVMPNRFIGKKVETGAAIELLALAEQQPGEWSCLAKPLKRLMPGTVVELAEDLQAEVLARQDQQTILVRFSLNNGSSRSLADAMHEVGSMPIPPYIRGGRADSQDTTDYQTLFAERDGSVAAPTASLHFTPALLETLRSMGVVTRYATLHVGAASFLPLWKAGEEFDDYTRPGKERLLHSPALLKEVESVRALGGRVVAVGTTVVRALESMARLGTAPAGPVETDLFISPGFDFRAVDAVITNFHQPRTTHMLLIQALLGREVLERSYQHALQNDYRFLSYGDAMFIGSRDETV